jgi:branched-chain amino acid transport system permease protein
MNALIDWLGKRVLRVSPYVHTLVVVAIFISLATNLFVAWYGAANRPSREVLAACLLMICAWLYLPVVTATDRLFREAGNRRGQTLDDALEQLLLLESESGTIRTVGRAMTVSCCTFFLALILLFQDELSRLPAFLSSFAQPAVNGLVAGSMYSLVALSFNLIYGTSRFFHFAHSSVIACGAYGAYLVVSYSGSAALGWMTGLFLAGVIGWIMNAIVYAKLRRRGARGTELLLASLGLMVATQAAISLLFGDDAKTLRAAPIAIGQLVISGVRLTNVQFTILVVSAAVLLSVTLFLRWTRVGVLVRAVSTDSQLALATGIPVETIISTAFVGGSIIAAIAGVLTGYDGSVTPTMGLRILIFGISAAIVGGIGTNVGALLGGILIGLTQHLTAVCAPTQWQDTGVFLVLIIFLLFRPQGFAGRPAVTAPR